MTKFSDAEKQRITDYYQLTSADRFDLQLLSRDLGRPKTSVCRTANRLGLTLMDRPASAAARATNKLTHADIWKRNPHPRGMLGKKHSTETLQIVSDASRKMWATMKTFGTGLATEEHSARRSRQQSERMASRPAHKTYTRTRGGMRDDLGHIHFRSSWEANYARYLNLLKKMGVVEHWDFEQEVFWFDGIRRGVTNYRPDFRVKYKGDDKLEYVEIKGWVQPKDRTKWRRMKKYHPHIKLVIVAQKQYEAIKRKWASAIPCWEGVHGGGRKLGPRKRAA